MSVMQTQRLNPLQFYRSSPAPCPYLPGRVERKLFARIGGPDAVAVNSTLSHAGFRRSHDIIYRPACPSCTACVPVRVPVASFEPRGSLSRIAKRGQDLVLTETQAIASREQYELFITYENRRHFDSDMASMSYEDYAAMIREGQADTTIFELKTRPSEPAGTETVEQNGQLAGIMLADKLVDGYSAVYSYFNTDEKFERYSLGTLLILNLIEAARKNNLPYVYLGYWVEGSRKMGYKSRFQPYEILGLNGWQPAKEEPAQDE